MYGTAWSRPLPALIRELNQVLEHPMHVSHCLPHLPNPRFSCEPPARWKGLGPPSLKLPHVPGERLALEWLIDCSARVGRAMSN